LYVKGTDQAGVYGDTKALIVAIERLHHGSVSTASAPRRRDLDDIHRATREGARAT